MNDEAWEQITNDGAIWDRFDERYRFRPGVDPATWPAIAEPAGSVTFDLAPVFARDARGFDADADALNRLVLDALMETFDDGAALVVLDWQHPSYRWRPHAHDRLGGRWRVEPFPNGDYHIVLTEDLRQGTFGHPWEQTFCVFGRDLVPRLAPSLADWLPVTRSHPAPADPR